MGKMEGKTSSSSSDQVVSSMTEQEEDLIHRMYRLVGKRWDLIAGRIPGRTSEEIELFWTTRARQASQNKKGY